LQGCFMKGSKFLLIVLSLLALPLFLFATYSIYNYLAFPEADLRHENLYIVAFMVLYGLFLFIPYIIAMAVGWHVNTHKLKLISALPFILLLFCAVFAELEGVPW
ncbi:hypothetical protein, partial [Aliiglaciecola lipolytica]